MFGSPKRNSSIRLLRKGTDFDQGQREAEFKSDEQRDLERKAEQDFKSGRRATDCDDFFSDDSLYITSDLETDEFSLFDRENSENGAENSELHEEPYEWFVNGIDAFQEEIQSDRICDVDTDANISIEERAYQVASNTGELVQWTGTREIELLANIFIENGWAINRTRLLKEIKAGMTYDMVRLAVKIRSLWNKHAEFQVGYYKGWMSDVYTNVEWRFCHSLILSYDSLPSEDEIEAYLLELFDGWYCSEVLRRLFLTFYSYISYRITSGIPFDMIPDIPFEQNRSPKLFQYISSNYSVLEF